MTDIPTQAELQDRLLTAIERQRDIQRVAHDLRIAERVPDAGTEVE